MWLCASMPCSQIVTLHAWACDYACTCMWLCAPMLCSQLVTKHACAYMHIFDTQSACNYVCMSMWLCIFMLWGQPVTMHACACDYAYLCYAASVIMKAWHFYAHFCCSYSWWLCMHVHVIMHTYAMHLVCNYVCKSLSYAPLCHAVISWLRMPVHVIMHIYSMQSVCKFACMSMWICTFTMSRQLATMHACACDYAHLCYAASL